MQLILGILSLTLLLGCTPKSESATIITNSKAQKETSMFGFLIEKETKKYVIASPLSGVLMKGGKPLINTKIVRRLTWNGNDSGILQEFMTDGKGAFSIPVHEETLTLSGITEFVASNALFVNEETEESLFWYSPKRQEELYSDTGGILEGMICDLDAEDERRDTTEFSAVLTKCTWENMHNTNLKR